MSRVLLFQDPDGRSTTSQTRDPKLGTDPADEPQLNSPYAVILYNDDINSFEFVVQVLARVLPCNPIKAFWLTLKVHFLGRGRIWTGSKKEAEQKATWIVEIGPDPTMKSRGAQPLRVTVEPVQ